MEVNVLSMWGALSYERSGLSFVGQSVLVSPLSVFTFLNTFVTHIYFSIFVQYIQGLCQSRLGTADYALFLVVFATTAV